MCFVLFCLQFIRGDQTAWRQALFLSRPVIHAVKGDKLARMGVGAGTGADFHFEESDLTEQLTEHVLIAGSSDVFCLRPHRYVSGCDFYSGYDWEARCSDSA